MESFFDLRTDAQRPLPGSACEESLGVDARSCCCLGRSTDRFGPARLGPLTPRFGSLLPANQQQQMRGNAQRRLFRWRRQPAREPLHHTTRYGRIRSVVSPLSVLLEPRISEAAPSRHVGLAPQNAQAEGYSFDCLPSPLGGSGQVDLPTVAPGCFGPCYSELAVQNTRC